MSLEQELATFNENARVLIPMLDKSLQAVYGALSGLGGQAVPAPAPVSEEPPPKAKGRAKAAEKPVEAPAAETSSAPSFDEVKRAVLKVASKSRQDAVDLLARFGVQRVTELAETQYAAVLEAALGSSK